MKRAFVAVVVVAATFGGALASESVAASRGISSSMSGFNWPNAAEVYVQGWDQRSVSAGDPSRPFRVARATGQQVVRVFVGTPRAIMRWNVDRAGMLARVRAMLDDASANGVKLILSNYLSLEGVSALAQRPYMSWAAAQRDLATTGSAPWVALESWMATLVPAFAGHPAVLSWEVTNEPSWMLGIDSGVVNVGQGLSFLDYFQATLHGHGATLVNMGGLPLFDPWRLTDAELWLATRNVDVLDHHFYPEIDGTDQVAAADVAVERYAAYVDRVRLLGRPLPAMAGEVGTVPSLWSQRVLCQAQARGWLALPWGFDSWDEHQFSDIVRPEVLSTPCS